MSQATILPSEHFSPSVSIHSGRPATTSREIATFFGKRHDDVIKSIRNLRPNCPEEFTARNFAASEYTDETGRTLPMFILYRDGFMLLVMGYTGKKALAMKLAYIEAFNRMEEELGRQKGVALPDESPAFPGSVSVTPSTVEDRKPLRSLVNAWAQVSAQPFNVCWSQLKAAFRLSDIRDMPQEWIPDALAWVQEKIDALPASSQPLPAGSSMLPEGFPADMEAGRKDALRKIRSIINAMEAARGVVSLFCYPPKRTMDMPRAQRLAYEANHDFYNAALDCLTAAHMALEAGYVLERTGKMNR